MLLSAKSVRVKIKLSKEAHSHDKGKRRQSRVKAKPVVSDDDTDEDLDDNVGHCTSQHFTASLAKFQQKYLCDGSIRKGLIHTVLSISSRHTCLKQKEGRQTLVSLYT